MKLMKDRGLKKWQGFIMPEQNEMLKQADVESLKIEKLILDEEQLYNINDLLVLSMQNEENIEITLWMDGFVTHFGPVIVYKIDPYQRKLYVQYEDGQQIFHFDSLIGAEIV